MSILGGILAGGRSTRMGSDKAEVEINGVTMLNRVHDVLSHLVNRVVILGHGREGFESWPDEASTPGPLAGVATALSRMSEDRALIVAVDNAFVKIETLRHLTAIESDLPVVLVDREGVRQVTCAVYPKGVAGPALEEAEAGGSVQTLLDRVSFLPVTPEQWSTWDEDGRSWFSVDSPQALETGLRRFT